MSFENFDVISPDKVSVVGYEWPNKSPKAVLQIVHGMSEHMGRYDVFASFMVKNGFAVVGHDHRGHGKTAGKIERIGHIADEKGMEKLVEDVTHVNKWIKDKYQGVPVFILGHSMGSFVLRKLMHDYPEVGDGYLISATGGHPGIKGSAGKYIISLIKLFGKRHRSKFLNTLAFGDFNRKYTDKKTIKDWLSRDEKIVKDYINDSYCMQIFSAQFFYDLTGVVLEINNEDYIKKTELNKPIYFFSGTMDPVGDYTKGVNWVVDKFMKSGANDVTYKLYENGRHEMLNEINKEEVYEDLLAWIHSKI